MLDKEYFKQFIDYFLRYHNMENKYSFFWTSVNEPEFYSYILTGDKNKTLPRFMKCSKEALKEKISENFKTVIEPILGQKQMDLEEYENHFEYISKQFNKSYQDIVFHLTDKGNKNNYYTGKKRIISANLYFEQLYNELFGESVELTPYDRANGEVVSFSNETEEAIDVAEELKYEKSKALAGRTVQSKLKAEEYGFEKDLFFRDFVSRYYDGQNLIDLVVDFVDSDDADFVAPSFLKWMKPVTNSAYVPVYIPCYYKQSLYCLLRTLKPSKWYKADDLYEAFKKSSGIIKISTNYSWLYEEGFPKFDAVFPDGSTGEDAFYRYYDEIISKPVFLGLLYTFALLGAIDITEKEAEAQIYKTKTKKVPYSPFNALDMISISDFGKWVLALSQMKPEKKVEFSEPVLDKDLLLITYKGSSIALKSFLSSIADPLGDIRYKVTLQSLTKNLTGPESFQKLLKEFRSHFNELPQIWVDFFYKVNNSFCIFRPEKEGMIYKIENEEAFKEMLSDPMIRKYFSLVEGGWVFIANDDEKRLRLALEKRGYKDPFVW